MSNLPQELINEIFLWLPVRSLVRFRCVCKLFNAMIQSKSFIYSHFERSSENNIHRKLIDLGVHVIDDNPEIHALEFNNDFQQELVMDKLHPIELHPLFFSYCNGLVLLFIDKLSLWNPSTKQYRILPTFPVNHTRNLKLALGYDSTTDDYKVVVVIPPVNIWDRSQVWIFELRSSSWRRIRDFPRVDFNIGGGGNGDCFVDGAIHFLCCQGDEINPSHRIVAFDIGKETFSVVNEPIYPTEVFATRLHVYGGCLAITLYSLNPGERVEMYVRKMDGVEFSWARLYSITEPRVSPEAFQSFASGRVAFSKEGNKVFLSPNGNLCSYDLEEKSLQEIVTINTFELDIFAYTESLVSVGS